MDSNQVRQKFLKFFEGKGHKIVPSSSLVPEGDISVLFTTAGMQQFKGYYSAPNNATLDFGTKNVTTVQKCVRTGDIDEVGDDTHLSFFEMLGNFSFGGYGRQEAITYAYEFITQELGLEISYVTYYKGSNNVPTDEASKAIWQNLGLSDEKIKEDGEDVFWGPTGDSGPCGPTTEIYCKNAKGEDVEIWNIVFNEYMCSGSREQLDKGQATLTKLDTLGIDTGMGLERLLATVQQKESVFDTDVFSNIISNLSGLNIKSARIVADHLRTSVFLINDGVVPSNKERGYVLRRLFRRAMVHLRGSNSNPVNNLDQIIDQYKTVYNLNKENILNIAGQEAGKFEKTLNEGIKKFESGEDPFTLFTTYGFPIELTLELAQEKGISINLDEFNKKLKDHQELSKTASAGMFKGGLANHNEATVRLHTAHHLLLSALQKIVSPDIKQRGSNITEERLRMDFTFDRKLTDEEKQKVESLVNDYIKAGYNVVRREMPLAEAEKLGAEMEFGTKYPETVSVYFIEDKDGNHISKEFCGGPHVENTTELGEFKIQKEEAVAQGIRRIKAVLS